MMKRIIIKYVKSFVYPDSLICVYLIYFVYLMKIIKLQMEDKMYIYGDREGTCSVLSWLRD